VRDEVDEDRDDDYDDRDYEEEFNERCVRRIRKPQSLIPTFDLQTWTCLSELVDFQPKVVLRDCYVFNETALHLPLKNEEIKRLNFKENKYLISDEELLKVIKFPTSSSSEDSSADEELMSSRASKRRRRIISSSSSGCGSNSRSSSSDGDNSVIMIISSDEEDVVGYKGSVENGTTKTRCPSK
jgi:hypothetical protein